MHFSLFIEDWMKLKDVFHILAIFRWSHQKEKLCNWWCPLWKTVTLVVPTVPMTSVSQCQVPRQISHCYQWHSIHCSLSIMLSCYQLISGRHTGETWDVSSVPGTKRNHHYHCNCTQHTPLWHLYHYKTNYFSKLSKCIKFTQFPFVIPWHLTV